MKIDNSRIIIEPFTVEYTKERVDWEKNRIKEADKKYNSFRKCFDIFVVLVCIVFCSLIFYYLFSIYKNIDAFYLCIFYAALILAPIILITKIIKAVVHDTRKWIPEEHEDDEYEALMSIQKMWKQIEKCIKDGTAEVSFKYKHKQDRYCLNIEYTNENGEKEKSKFKLVPDKKERNADSSDEHSPVVISFYDTNGQHWRNYTDNEYVSISLYNG